MSGQLPGCSERCMCMPKKSRPKRALPPGATRLYVVLGGEVTWSCGSAGLAANKAPRSADQRANQRTQVPGRAEERCNATRLARAGAATGATLCSMGHPVFVAGACRFALAANMQLGDQQHGNKHERKVEVVGE